MAQFTRRSLLQAAGTGLAASLLTPLVRSAGQEPKRDGVTRLVFLTDSHVPGERTQNGRFEKALALAKSEKADAYVFGGDNVMAVDGGRTRAHADAEFSNWKALIDAHVPVPHHSVIGNHDIWWTDDAHAGSHKDKGYAIEIFKMPHRYFAANIGEWKFLFLDVYHKDGCHVDEEQMKWLDAETKDDKAKIALVSHAPILTVTSYIETETAKEGAFHVPAGWMVGNAQAIRDLLFDRPQVKLALSGHMHQIDHCIFDHCHYICGGAVSGSWWSGSYYKFPPAYLVFDLQPDGKFSHRLVYWEAAAS